MAVGNYASVAPVMSSARRQGRTGLAIGLAALALVAVACVAIATKGSISNKPDVTSMYHMWLGANGLPVSPRKQRQLLFQFCTTNFVTEEEMRYCYARLLSNGDPSGPVKFAGQPNYDSEQVVAPLFSFAMPASATGGGEAAGGGAAAAPAAAQAPVVSLKAIYKPAVAQPAKGVAELPPALPTKAGAKAEWKAFDTLEMKKTGTPL